jgi:hypothetical protein
MVARSRLDFNVDVIHTSAPPMSGSSNQPFDHDLCVLGERDRPVPVLRRALRRVTVDTVSVTPGLW